MWTYTITDKKLVNGIPYLTVQFTNGASTFSKDLVAGSLDNFKIQIQTNLDQCQASDTLIKSVSTGTIDLSVIPPVLTDQQTFAKNYQKLKLMSEAVNLGVIDSQNQDYVNLLSLVKGTWNIDYLF